MGIKEYLKKVKDFSKKRYGGQSVFANIAMLGTILFLLMGVIFHNVVFSILTLLFTILWGIASIGKGEKNEDYSSPDLEGQFLHWLWSKIKKLFGR